MSIPPNQFRRDHMDITNFLILTVWRKGNDKKQICLTKDGKFRESEQMQHVFCI